MWKSNFNVNSYFKMYKQVQFQKLFNMKHMK